MFRTEIDRDALLAKIRLYLALEGVSLKMFFEGRTICCALCPTIQPWDFCPKEHSWWLGEDEKFYFMSKMERRRKEEATGMRYRCVEWIKYV